MKYVVLTLLLLALSIIVPILIFILIERIKNKKYKLWIKALVTSISSIFIIIFTICTYLGVFYRATDDVLNYLKSDNDVVFYETDDYYFFDNKNNDEKAIIFYPGGKVDESSYAPLISKIAHDGIDAYIVKMPFHFALFGINKANLILNNTNYKDIYLMGHSLGGTSITSYLSKSSYYFKGIIYLASYPSNKISDDLSSLSIYGTNDEVLNKDEYIKNKELLPKNNYEVVIEGGNHGYFGNYGEQRHDGIATITREAQQELTKAAIIKFINGTI